MDDSTNVELVDVSPIGSPDRFQVTVKHLWRTGEPHHDPEDEDTGDVVDDSNYCHGPHRWLPHPSGDLRMLKPLTLDANLPPPFDSPGYPSTIESTPPTSSYTPDYFDLGGKSLLPPAKVDDDMRFCHYPHLLICDPEDFDDAYPWDLHSRFSAFWDAGDDSDASEPSDEPTDYFTFAGQSASIPPELELVFRQINLSEPSSFVLDFPEDVGESLEQDTVLADGDPGVIGRLGQPTPVPAPKTPVELSVQPHVDSQTLSVYASEILLPRIRKISEDNNDLDLVLHSPHPGSDVPTNVPLSPFVTDGFPDDTTPLYSGLVDVEAEGISMDADWLGGPWGEMICSPRLEEELVEWDRWRGQLVEELNRDLDSWAEVRGGVWGGL